MKTYSTKANAKRAAKTAGYNSADVTILEKDGKFGFKPNHSLDLLLEAETQVLKERQKELLAITVEAIVGYNPNLLLPCPINAVKSSAVKNPVKTVWDIADKMWGERRKDIIAACVNAGIAYNTARTQYQAYYAIKSKEGK